MILHIKLKYTRNVESFLVLLSPRGHSPKEKALVTATDPVADHAQSNKVLRMSMEKV